MRSTPLLPLLLGSFWPRVGAPDRALSMGQIEVNRVITLNWIVWNRTVFTFNNVQTKNCTYADWIDWNRTVDTYKNGSGIE